MQKIVAMAALSLLVLACQTTPSNPANRQVMDPHSHARPAQAIMTHLDLAMAVDFRAKAIIGTASITFDCHDADSIFLDSDGLIIHSITVDDKPVDWLHGEANELLGRGICIVPSEPVTGTYVADIHYASAPDATALQWLRPEQTNGKTQPFLFTQSQAILARTWIPCQDGPGVRFTYHASVKVPSGLMAVMSATNPTTIAEDGVYEFDMRQPIPSYLMALAVGDLAFQSTGPRTGVYAEPAILKKSAWEFAETEAMIQAAEALYGPYAWDQYDLLVLPASFPFGGMENPRLTFLTPTVITGDRSLVSLIAHELAHSWSGNLVTNATWNDFWLNEGFTVYFEHRIMAAVYGEDYANMLRALSHAGLVDEVNEMMVKHPEDSKLDIALEGRNPDDAMTAIAYDKGFHFLLLVEEAVGKETFDAFLTTYFQDHQFKSMTTDRFIAYLKDQLLDAATWEQILGEEWVYGTGLPDNCPVLPPLRFEAVDLALDGFLSEGSLMPQDQWTTHEWLRFLDQLGNKGANLSQVIALDGMYHLTASSNAEIQAAWFALAIPLQYRGDGFQTVVEQFLTSVGRRKFLTPTYKAMLEAGDQDWAMTIYQAARPGYHAVATQTMDDLLGFKPAS
ncbi:MAG: M1 family metallopeptidase [Flavobacteriales bacterium]|nr:M1 family metallopeptidase [Flavobacteriales bacterium]